MIFNKRRKAFSLTELLIAVVVIAVLFSAMLPIMTKRRNGATLSNEPVWQYVPGEQRDAFYDKNVPSFSSTAFIGLDPDKMPLAEKNGKYASKVHIRAGQPEANSHQNHIQFRYGSANGNLAGLFVVDNKGNILGTGKLTGDSGENSNSIVSKSANVENTVWGNGAFARIKSASGITSIGANASMGRKNNSSLSANVTAIGAGANQYGKSSNSVLLGAGAGKTEDGSVSNTVAIGAGSLGVPNADAKSGVFVGADTAIVEQYGTGDIVLGSNYIGNSTSDYNTVLGFGAFSNSNKGSNAKYMTAVGENACNTFSTNSPSKKTCIGHDSGGSYGSSTTSSLGWEQDGMEHIFLGGAQQNGAAGGRSVLEIHNMYKNANSEHGAINKTGNLHPGGARPNIAPTVVMNSNLVVRGNVYWPTTDGVLRPHGLFLGGGQDGTETGTDRCDRRCHSRFGRKYWRGGQCGGIFSDFIDWATGALGFVGAFLSSMISGTIALTGCVITLGQAFEDIAKGFDGGGDDRTKDPVTANAVIFTIDSNSACATNSQNYPVTGKGCPDLRLSDIRLKDNISENHDAIKKLLYIMPYDYTFKADKTKRPQVGVIAQDLQVYFPNSVREDKDGHLNIRLDEMFFATINTMKDLDKIVQNAENEVTILEGQAEKVDKSQKLTEKRINDMNKRLNKLEK